MGNEQQRSGSASSGETSRGALYQNGSSGGKTGLALHSDVRLRATCGNGRRGALRVQAVERGDIAGGDQQRRGITRGYGGISAGGSS